MSLPKHERTQAFLSRISAETAETAALQARTEAEQV